MPKATGLDPALADYVTRHSVSPHPVISKLCDETATLENGGMRSADAQGTLLQMLVKLSGATHTLEVGVFTGFSSLSVALALPEGGTVTALEFNEGFAAIARKYWEEAGVAERIDLRLGLAVDNLDALLSEGKAGLFDFAFIDADKRNYQAYYEKCLELVRPGGLICVDNCFWGGSVLDDQDDRPQTVAIRDLNAFIQQDKRVENCLIPIGDGMMLVRKRS